MKYYRKIFASYLSQKGIQSEIIDLLQGRVPPSVFARNYLRPAEDLKDKVLQAVSELSVKL
jgi:intergrase/recombinase